jgi:hypothetical protein
LDSENKVTPTTFAVFLNTETKNIMGKFLFGKYEGGGIDPADW